MSARYLGFVLLIWFPGAIHAQTCQAPQLKGGYFVPEQETYDRNAKLTYACDRGLKPAAEGWWVTSSCQNGKWSQEPKCIDQNACLPPVIPNGKYRKRQKGWYEARSTIRVECEDGYELKDISQTTCTNGSWPSLPVCERSNSSCSEPPKISHAVVIHQGYQEVFGADSEVHYECKDGYTKEGNDNIICTDGKWTVGPTCNRRIIPGHHGSAAGRESGEHQTSPGRGSQPSVGGMGRGQVEHAGSGRQPSGGGSSGTSGSNIGDHRPLLTNIRSCGTYPVVQNAEVVEEASMHLKYQCNSFYTRVGPETVHCYGDGTWSELPSCEERFCVIDTTKFDRLQPTGAEYLEEGKQKYLSCIWGDRYAVIKCTNRRMFIGDCCSGSDFQRGLCNPTEPVRTTE